MLSELLGEIHDELPTGLGNGYSGIGWSIEYLMQCGFVEGDSNEVLEEIDKKIVEIDVKRIGDTSLLSGLEGLFHYILIRLYKSDSRALPFDEEYIENLTQAANLIVGSENEMELISLASMFLSWQGKKTTDYNPELLIKKILADNTNGNIDISTATLGLKDGCAGIGLQLIFDEEKSIHN